MKHDLVTKVDLYVNGSYYTTLDRAVLCSKDEAPSDLNLHEDSSENIVAIYKSSVPEDRTPKKNELDDFFRKMQEERLKIFK